jgi:hypothetical protein
MDMDRRTWIAGTVVVVVVVVIGYVVYSRPSTMETPKPSSTTTQPIAPPLAPTPTPAPAPAPKP